VVRAEPATAVLTGTGWRMAADPAARGGIALVAHDGIPLATPVDAPTTWADLALQVRGGVDYQVRIRARGDAGGEGVALEVRGGTALKPSGHRDDPVRASWQRFIGFTPSSAWRDDAESPDFAHMALRVRFARSGWAVLRLHPLAGELRIEAIDLVEVPR
jgi:hypothetical protein